MCSLVSRLHLSLFIRFIVIFNVIVFFLGYLYRFGGIVLSAHGIKRRSRINVGSKRLPFK